MQHYTSRSAAAGVATCTAPAEDPVAWHRSSSAWTPRPGVLQSGPAGTMRRMAARSHSSLAPAFALAYALLVAYACLHPLTGWRDSGLPAFDWLWAPWPKYFILEDLLFNRIGGVHLSLRSEAVEQRKSTADRNARIRAIVPGEHYDTERMNSITSCGACACTQCPA